MFFGQVEKELFSGEIWSIWQTSKLPDHLQLLVDQEGVERDIWELQSQELDTQSIYPSIENKSSTLSS
jgi:hypothetical protein